MPMAETFADYKDLRFFVFLKWYLCVGSFGELNGAGWSRGKNRLIRAF
jgi:hypothetical protein